MPAHSKPFTHSRYLFLNLAVDKARPSLYLFNEILFALAYFVGRILFGTWLVYVSVTCDV